MAGWATSLEFSYYMTRTTKIDPSPPTFLPDGYERAIGAIEAEVRPEVEQRYCDEWNASGLIKRWFLLRRIKREIAVRVAERAAKISAEALF